MIHNGCRRRPETRPAGQVEGGRRESERASSSSRCGIKALAIAQERIAETAPAQLEAAPIPGDLGGRPGAARPRGGQEVGPISRLPRRSGRWPTRRCGSRRQGTPRSTGQAETFRRANETAAGRAHPGDRAAGAQDARRDREPASREIGLLAGGPPRPATRATCRPPRGCSWLTLRLADPQHLGDLAVGEVSRRSGARARSAADRGFGLGHRLRELLAGFAPQGLILGRGGQQRAQRVGQQRRGRQGQGLGGSKGRDVDAEPLGPPRRGVLGRAPQLLAHGLADPGGLARSRRAQSAREMVEAPQLVDHRPADAVLDEGLVSKRMAPSVGSKRWAASSSPSAPADQRSSARLGLPTRAAIRRASFSISEPYCASRLCSSVALLSIDCVCHGA